MEKNKILITTNLKDTWKDSNEAFFTGEWCINYKDKIPYKKYFIEKDLFKDRNKFYDDYLYIGNFYKKFIKIFSSSLNHYHGTNYSIKFWEIFIGIWLRSFIEITYAHYKKIKKIINLYEPDYSVIREFENNHFFIKNYKVYYECIQTSSWRHYLQSEIIRNLKEKIVLEKVYNKNDIEFFQFKNKKIKNKFSTKIIKKIYLNIFKKKIINSKYFINKTYLSSKNEILLNLNLKNFPVFIDLDYDFKIDRFERYKLKFDFDFKDEFEEIIAKIISNFMPSSYLENFEELKSILLSKVLPAKPETIFSSHLFHNELLSLYTALTIEKNKTKLIYGQHGGVYGQYKFSTLEDHELSLSDEYLTWGWSKNKKTQSDRKA